MRAWWSLAVLVAPLAGFCFSGCNAPRKLGDEAQVGWSGLCVDADGDDFGERCARGSDCDDADPDMHAGCATCAVPSEGCACGVAAPPVSCKVSSSVTDRGSLRCTVGTRFCRDGAYSACEGIASFEMEPPSRLGPRLSALIDADAGLVACDPCEPGCFRIDDTLRPVADPGHDVAAVGTGGITIHSEIPDAGPGVPVGGGTSRKCIPGVGDDTDCDGIPDQFDEVVGAPPFGSDHEAIFMELAPGESASEEFDITFYLRTADIYFLLDMTGSMGDERDRLTADLTTGNFLAKPSATECADRNFDGSPDNELRTRGIAGNIACVVRNARIGTGWFREIPFEGPDNAGIYYGDDGVDSGDSTYGQFVFEHRSDISDNVDQALAALRAFDVAGNSNWAEAGTQALYSVVTGDQLYMGWDRPAVPQRVDCPAGTWGYPCFREDALPVVIMISDAPMMDGPATSDGSLGNECVGWFGAWCTRSVKQPIDYPRELLNDNHLGTGAAYIPVPNNTNERFDNAYDAGKVISSFKTYTGNTRVMRADVSAAMMGCEDVIASDEGADAVFKFRVDTQKRLTVSAQGTRFDAVMAIVPDDGTLSAPPAPSTINLTSTISDQNDTAARAANLGSLPANVGLTVRGDSSRMASELPRETVGCFKNNSSNQNGQPNSGSDKAPDAFFKFQLARDTRVRFAAEGGDFDAALSLFRGTPRTPTDLALTGNEDDYATSYALGDIRGRSVRFTNGDTSARGIRATYRSNEFVAAGCSNASSTSEDQVVSFDVLQTTRVRIETSGGNVDLQANFDHMIGLVVRDSGQMLECDYEGLDRRRSLIERTLAPGRYSVIVRGRRSLDDGQYKLSIRDVDFAPTSLGCHNQVRGNSRAFAVDLTAKDGSGSPVTYYLAMRANDTDRGAGSGPYTLRINGGGARAQVCADDVVGTAPAVTLDFSPGDYYVVLKGASTSEQGWYQVTIGDPTKATTGQYADKRWGTAGGVREKLVEKGVRVITVRSSGDRYAREQMESLSRSTGAVSSAGSPLTFDISSDGSGMGSAIINAVQALAQSLEMDVGVRLVESPDKPTPRFGFRVRAVDRAGDLCSPPVDRDMDAQRTPDTHKRCAPGAMPRFEVTFENPANAPVPCNGHDANGVCKGYNMRIELIGDGRYVVDSIPVYIIPADVVPDRGAPVFESTATYSQTTSSRGCQQTETPEWEGLSWNATLPADTKITWRMCGADEDADLAGCTLRTLAEVTPGGACTKRSDCTDGGRVGFCQARACQYALGPKCVADAQCGVNGYCRRVAGNKSCMWDALPIDPTSALFPGQDRKPHVRVAVTLSSNPNQSAAPTIHDFHLRYECGGTE